MADKDFGVKGLRLVGPSGTPTIHSPNNLNVNAVNVAISTDISIGGTCTAYQFDGAIAGWNITNDYTNHYIFTGPGLGSSSFYDPDIHLVRGQKYIFHNRSSGHPFRIQSTSNGSTGTQYNLGVVNNDGAAPTDIIFDVPFDAPNILYYQCTSHPKMGGRFIIGGGGNIPQNAKTSSYTLMASDTGKHISITTGGVTVPYGVFKTGDVVTIYNNSSSSQTITQGTLITLRQAGTSNIGNRTLAGYGVATLMCVASDTEFVISGEGLS